MKCKCAVFTDKSTDLQVQLKWNPQKASQGHLGRCCTSSLRWALCIFIISAVLGEVTAAESCFLVLLGGAMWSTDNPLQRSDEDKRAICVEKDFFPPSSLKAYHTRAEVWHHHFVSHLAVTRRATRSVTQRLTSPSVDLDLNTSVSGATARKCALFNHLSVFWGSEARGDGVTFNSQYSQDTD